MFHTNGSRIKKKHAFFMNNHNIKLNHTLSVDIQSKAIY
jgi:hypothetical protein